MCGGVGSAHPILSSLHLDFLKAGRLLLAMDLKLSVPTLTLVPTSVFMLGSFFLSSALVMRALAEAPSLILFYAPLPAGCPLAGR